VRTCLAVRLLACCLALAAAPVARAQTTPTDDESSYWDWRATHVDRAEQALAAQLAGAASRLPCALPTADAPASGDGPTLAAIVGEALAVHPPETLIFAHGEYLLALEQLRLAVEALQVGTAGSRRAEQAAALVCERAAALDAQRQPVAGATPPPASATLPGLPLPSRPSPPLASAARDGVEVAVLDVRRPYVPADGPPADPALEYLLVRFRLTNGGAQALPYYPLADFELRLPDASTLHPLALGPAERSTSGELAPGDGLIAEVAFLVPRELRPLVLRLTPASGPTVEVPLP